MKRKRFWLPLSIFIIAFAFPARPATAQFQDSMGMNFNNGSSALASTAIWSSIFYRTPAASNRTSRTSPSQTRSPRNQTAKPTNPNAIQFRPTGTYLKTRALAESLGNSAAEREQYQKLMNTVLDAFGQQAQKAGFPNDIAAAIAFFLGENIRIYRGLPDLSDQQYINLRNTIADALVSSGALNNLTDRQKQEMYETLVAYTGITQYGYEQGVQARNDAIIKGYQKVAGQNLRTVTKMSPDSMNLTTDGPAANPPE